MCHLELLVHGQFQLLLVSAEEPFSHLEQEEHGVKFDVKLDVGMSCVCVHVCVCVCVEGSKVNHCNRHTHHDMVYGMWLFIIHGHAYTWRSGGYHVHQSTDSSETLFGWEPDYQSRQL